MAVRTTVDIPEQLHQELRDRSQQSGTSMRLLIIQAIEQAYGKPRKVKMVTGPMITGKGKLGPRFPVDENPHDLVFT
jgi:hypothetical protein